MENASFYEWTEEKVSLQGRDTSRLFFQEGEVWVYSCGINIGYEQNGKGINKIRPILIIKKFNNDLFWGIPLSTTKKNGKYYFSYHFAGGVEGKALLSQMRLYDKKRLLKKIDEIPHDVLRNIKKRLIAFLL